MAGKNEVVIADLAKLNAMVDEAKAMIDPDGDAMSYDAHKALRDIDTFASDLVYRAFAPLRELLTPMHADFGSMIRAERALDDAWS